MGAEHASENPGGRRAFLRGLALAGGAGLLAACSQSAFPATSTRPATANVAGQDWEALLTAARAEGTVVINAGPGGDVRTALVESFEQAYPGITVEGVFSPAAETLARIQAERASGKYLVDVL